MDKFYVSMLSDSLGVPDAYMDDVDQQEAGNVMLALTGYRFVNVGARLALEKLLYTRARGAQRGFYQQMTILKTWATKSPYERPWCLSPAEFTYAVPLIVKGKLPNPGSSDWFEKSIPHALAALGIVALMTFMFPEEEIVVAAGSTAKAIGGVGGALDLADLVRNSPGPTVTRAYEIEARRRSYSPSI